MDLQRIVEEVEERKRYELALVGPSDPSARPAPGGGAAGSLLVAVRERMLAENPKADVGHIDEALSNSPAPPDAREERDPPAKRPTAHAKVRAQEPPSDDFLTRYLEMSVEFEERFGVKGWADFVAKKTEGHAARHYKAPPPGPAKAKGKRKPGQAHRRK